MSMFDRFRFAQRAADLAAAPSGVIPPARQRASSDPLTMNTIFRGVQILQTAVSGLPIVQTDARGHRKPLDAIVAQPDIDKSRADFLSETVAALALNGNAYWLKIKGIDDNVVTLRQLPSDYVTVTNTTNDILNPRYAYGYGGRTFTDTDIIHLKFMAIPGRVYGLGPIQAARQEIEGARDARDYKANWFDAPHNPSGILSVNRPLSDSDAAVLKKRFMGNLSAGEPAVLADGISYTPFSLSPSDLQFLETQKFDTTQIARLLGIPASLMLAATDGNSLTYSNIEQEWVQFADFTLAAYTDDIASALTQLTARGNTIRFDWDSMRRADTKTRMETYKIAVDTGIMTINEARAGLGLEPLEQGDTISHA